jgi:hypothetical protein
MQRDQPDDYARYAGLHSRLLIRGSARETSPAADLCTNAPPYRGLLMVRGRLHSGSRPETSQRNLMPDGPGPER